MPRRLGITRVRVTPLIILGRHPPRAQERSGDGKRGSDSRRLGRSGFDHRCLVDAIRLAGVWRPGPVHRSIAASGDSPAACPRPTSASDETARTR